MKNIDPTQALLPSGSRVLCAVSGGADSMCLLHLLSQREDLFLTAAHFNHQLRGRESEADEAFVRDVCAQWNIPFTAGRGDVAGFARREGLSTEEAARVLRYAFLERAAQAEGCGFIATAHNADDNAETILLHLVRGAGLQGLTGIPPQRGNIVRPLLGLTRLEIMAYLEEHGIPHREDLSNFDEAYSRNRLRSQVMPVLRELNPRFSQSAFATSRFLREDNDYLNAQAAKLSSGALVENGQVTIPALLIAQAPHPIAIRAVRQLWSVLTGGDTDCAAAHLEAIAELCRKTDPSARLSLPHGVVARREYERLILSFAEVPSPGWEPFSPVEGDNPVPGTVWTVVLDGPPWPGLAVRRRRQGDAVTLPSGHTKSLKRLLIDKKVPREQREDIPIVADSHGVIAVAGLGLNLSHPCRRQVKIKHTEEKEYAGN